MEILRERGHYFPLISILISTRSENQKTDRENVAWHRFPVSWATTFDRFQFGENCRIFSPRNLTLPDDEALIFFLKNDFS